MKILHLSTSDIRGGAAIAAYRLHTSLTNETSVYSRMMVARYFSSDPTVYPAYQKNSLLYSKLRVGLSKVLTSSLRTNNKIIHSPSLFPSLLTSKINKSNIDIVHIHWVQSEFISISDIARIKKPIVWTFHDMWPLCGAEHCSFDDRCLVGYLPDNRPKNEAGFDLNRWCWNLKYRLWKRPFNIIAPSRWMAYNVSNSALFSQFPVNLIHNPIDLSFWSISDKKAAQELFSLPLDSRFILFGASGGINQFHKGFDLLQRSLLSLRRILPNQRLYLVVFGDKKPKNPIPLGLPVIYIGSLIDQVSLKALYNAVDAVVVPSRLDNLPNIAVESISCSTPVIAFNIGGLSDIIAHKYNGYLAKPFDCEDLAFGIKYVLDNSELFSSNARSHASKNFCASIIAEQFHNLYDEILVKSSFPSSHV